MRCPRKRSSRRLFVLAPSAATIFIAVFLVFLPILHSALAEYTWNGTEWVWNEESPGSTNEGTVDAAEGSGDDSGVRVEDARRKNVVDSRKNSWSDSDDDDVDEDEYEYEGSGEYDDEDYGDDDDGEYEDDDSEDSYGSPVDSTMDYGSSHNDGKNDDIYVDGPPPPQSRPGEDIHGGINNNNNYNDLQNKRPQSHTTSFFAKPGTLAAVVGGAVVGLLCAILCVMFVVYRMRKKDEGSYALDEPKRSPTVNSYSKAPSREFYA